MLPAPLRFMAVVGIALVCAWLLWLAVGVHLERACTLADTPYLPLCNESESEAERQLQLREYLAANPGDSGAWIRLTSLETGPHEQALLHAASTLAPNEPNVLMWRAGEALRENKLEKATEVLVQLVQYRGKREAAQVLAQLVASGEGAALLRPYLQSSGRWLPQVLAAITAQKLPVTSALPLLAEASAKAVVPQQTVKAFIRALKAEGQWSDAHALWIAQLGKGTPLVFNGSFDDAFQSDGFDWEVASTPPSRAGAVVRQRGVRQRGQVIEIQFTGKPFAVPVVRQYLFLPPGKYMVRGEYSASRLRMEQGLAWVVRCSNSKGTGSLAGQSAGLLESRGAWRKFEFPLAIPPDCGLVASLQLETVAPFEAKAGFKGSASFDALEILPQAL
ncbi:MAG: hypothetical protein Q8M07_18935 [Prosthecobacter sp.]|nr:hypothetical protein [Prosthecobacter sp.]